MTPAAGSTCTCTSVSLRHSHAPILRTRRLGVCIVVTGLVGLAGCRADASSDAAEDITTCTVARLSDGDSLHCVEGAERVRLLLIDAPEMAQVPWGDSAKAVLATLLPAGRAVRLEYDLDHRDDYGRLLAYLWLDDGRMVNEVMADDGFVVLLYYAPNGRYRDRIEAAVDAARAAHRGLWATPAFDCLPVDFRAGRCGGG